MRRLFREQNGAEHHGGGDRHHIGLEQVCGHAGAIADIVAHIVRDGGGVARIVFRNAGFDFPDHVAANVSALGENAAAKTREDGDQRRAKRQGDQPVHHRAAFGRMPHRSDEDHVVTGEPDKRETGHQHAGNRARAESNRQAFLQAFTGGLRRAHIRPHRHQHADKTGGAGKNGADCKTERRNKIKLESGQQNQKHHRSRNGDCRILLIEIGLRAFLNSGGDFPHPVCSGRQRQHPVDGEDAIGDCEHAGSNDQP